MLVSYIFTIASIINVLQFLVSMDPFPEAAIHELSPYRDDLLSDPTLSNLIC